MTRSICVLCLAMLCASAALAQAPGPVELSARVDRSSAALGETVVLTVDVRYPPDVEVHLPPADSLDLAPFEVRDAVVTPQPMTGGRKVVRYSVRLAAYEPGKQTVPPLKVEYKAPDETTRTAESAPIDLEISRAGSVPAPGPSALSSARPPGVAAAQKPEIRDLKQMDEIPTPAWMYAAAALAGAAVLALLGFGLRALVGRLRVRKPVPATPHGVALAALDALVALNLPAQGHLKAHYDRLSQILRAYLSRRFELPVLEHTTAEVLAMMRARDLDEQLRSDVRLVLDEADLVKFARLHCPAEKAVAQTQAVRSIVERTIPIVEPSSESPPQPSHPSDAVLPSGAGGRER